MPHMVVDSHTSQVSAAAGSSSSGGGAAPKRQSRKAREQSGAQGPAAEEQQQPQQQQAAAAAAPQQQQQQQQQQYLYEGRYGLPVVRRKLGYAELIKAMRLGEVAEVRFFTTHEDATQVRMVA
jgi:hypothetical protein